MEDFDSDERVDTGGLLGGLTAYHIRLLCENPWEGGGGYTMDEVGQMTLDQIWARLCDRDVLKKSMGNRTSEVDSLEIPAVLRPDKDGMIRGISQDGQPMKGRIAGKSKARQLMEQQQEKRAQEKRARRRKRSRR